MSFAFELKNNKDVRDDGLFQSFKIVSLWEVLRFYTEKFANTCRLMAEICMMLMDSRFKKIELSQPLLDELVWLHEAASELKLRSVPVSVERLLRDLQSSNADNSQIKRDAHELLQRIIDEFKGQLVMAIEAVQAEYYEQDGTFLGRDVVDKLSNIPGLIEDAAEAGNCFAFERYTACVFHLMRAMERCVQKFGSDLGLSDTITCEKEWQIILNQIRGAIKVKWPKEKDPDRMKHESTIGHLETVKIVWRNPTMHPKATYTREEAQKIMNAVQAFVEDFSTL